MQKNGVLLFLLFFILACSSSSLFFERKIKRELASLPPQSARGYLSTPPSHSICEEFERFQREAPSCPKNGTALLPDHYPMLATVVSDAEGIRAQVSVRYVMAILRAQPEFPPRIFLMATRETQLALKNEIENGAPSQAVAERWLAAVTLLPPASGYIWMQDAFQAYFDRQTGRPVLRDVESYYRYGSVIDENIEKKYPRNLQAMTLLTETLLQQCGAIRGELLPASVKNDRPISADFGGNLEAVPGGLCVVGNREFGISTSSKKRMAAWRWISSDPHQNRIVFSPPQISTSKPSVDFNEFLNARCEPGSHIVAETDGILQVGHIDEIFKTIRDPRKKAPCDFQFLIASPSAAVRLLEQNPNEPAFDFQLEESEVEPLFERGAGYRRLCQKLEKDSPQACLSIKNADLLQLFRQDPALIELMRRASQQVDSFRTELFKKTKERTSCEPEVIEVPTLFFGEAIKEKKPMRLKWQNSLYPNLANSEFIGTTVLSPDPVNPTFRREMQRLYKSRGLKVQFIETSHLHQVFGNLHCVTNSIRYCRP